MALKAGIEKARGRRPGDAEDRQGGSQTKEQLEGHPSILRWADTSIGELIAEGDKVARKA